MDKARATAASTAVAQPQMIPPRTPAGPSKSQAKPSPLAVSVPAPAPATKVRNSVMAPDAFSSSVVTENGSYEFDRVLKSGYVRKRTRKTKSWKSIYLVLRPTSISIYKDQEEAKLRHKILLSDLTAVAFLKDPKHKRHNVFGLFSPSRNYHLEALSKSDAAEWVDLIRREARIEEEEEEMFLASPTTNTTHNYAGLDAEMRKRTAAALRDAPLETHRGSSSPEPSPARVRPVHPPPLDPKIARRPSHFEYSGTEPASHSDFSDVETHFNPSLRPKAAGSSRVSIPEIGESSASAAVVPGLQQQQQQQQRPIIGARNGSQLSSLNLTPDADPERVIWQGHLLYLKSKSGVRQWKDLWCVLRARTFALYKDENEYAPLLILELGNIINVVEIDPVSRTKRNCLQVITEERSYRFCARSEEGLDLALGGFKSLLVRRREGSVGSGGGVVGGAGV
ncbi:hypothetical protein GMDG_01668 [Pseudogymnoascus destructans 20631-21]|uniref:PH domain-containing protein n=1 Tax=Pseudogymnoascus destructans (strain ATCC MYA-4855 / 20631-21) TaxID=658429 RepID=L8FWA6_PSED2|nr:hypothetical protein GMDG_01668 [Pseudogymnoascus destructans 20631-21]